MAIYKRGGVYWYKFMWNGRHIRESAKTGNPKTARQIESARKTELAKGEVGIKDRPPAPTFEEFSKRFTNWIATEKAAKPKTVQFYKDCVKQLLRFERFRTVLLDQIDEGLIADYIKRRTGETRRSVLRRKDGGYELRDTLRPVTVASVNRELATLRRALNVWTRRRDKSVVDAWGFPEDSVEI